MTRRFFIGGAASFGEFRFVVTPMNCFHDRGTALATDWMKRDERGEA